MLVWIPLQDDEELSYVSPVKYRPNFTYAHVMSCHVF